MIQEFYQHEAPVLRKPVFQETKTKQIKQKQKNKNTYITIEDQAKFHKTARTRLDKLDHIIGVISVHVLQTHFVSTSLHELAWAKNL